MASFFLWLSFLVFHVHASSFVARRSALQAAAARPRASAHRGSGVLPAVNFTGQSSTVIAIGSIVRWYETANPPPIQRYKSFIGRGFMLKEPDTTQLYRLE